MLLQRLRSSASHALVPELCNWATCTAHQALGPTKQVRVSLGLEAAIEYVVGAGSSQAAQPAAMP